MPLQDIPSDPTGAYAVLGWHQGDVMIMTDAVGIGIAASGEVTFV